MRNSSTTFSYTLNTQSLSLVLAGQPILKNITLHIPEAEITALIGASGSGKTTLLRCFNRLIEPPPTTIFLDDQDIIDIDILSLRRQIGMLRQNPIMFPGSVADNIAYGAVLRNETLSHSQISRLLKKVDLPIAWLDKQAKILSGGQIQRVALARTLANKPQLLLLDEPTSALDPKSTHLIEEIIRHLCTEEGLTAVWVSHSIEQVRRVSTHAVLLHEGSVLNTGPPNDILDGFKL